MLQRLTIENFVLVKSCDIQFSSHFNIITGETGAGKSVLLSALQLLLGARVENESIRHGEEKATIEGEFIIEQSQAIQALFDEYEIDSTPTLTLTRELHANGKHKSYVNGQIVQSGFIKALSPHLITHYDQETSLQLRSHAYALEQLDLFGNNSHLKTEFQNAWNQLQSTQSLYTKLLEEEQYKEIELEQLKRDIGALASLSLESLDDEKLFTLYQQGKNKQKLEEKLQLLTSLIDEPPSGILSKVKQALKIAQDIPSLSEFLESASASLQEASFYVEKQLNSEIVSKEELDKIESRLSLFDTLKRKYLASSKEELQKTLLKKEMRKKELLEREEKINDLQETISKEKTKVDQLALSLSETRAMAAKKLSLLIEQKIRRMNMPEASFQTTILKTNRSSSGDDECHFSFFPNPGEKIVDVHTGASNGELARIFLALAASIASKEEKTTLLFDEIDANIGGITARAVGELLKEIAKERQVLAITHFPQVAESADTHFVLSKEVVDNRTVSTISKISKSTDRKKEHLRMAGKTG